jgi:hypothetical protein
MRWLIYRKLEGAWEPLRIVDAETSTQAIERVQASTPQAPDQQFDAVAEAEADKKDWQIVERETLKTTKRY